MNSIRPTRAEISFNALKHNFGVAKDLANESKLLAVVKAEAYGHGLLEMASRFAEFGADYLGVSFLEEGVTLRKAGIILPILVFGGFVDEQVEQYLEYDLEITVSSVWKAKQVNTIARNMDKRAKVHLKIDTGMGRIGQHWQTAELLFKEVVRLPHLEVTGLYTHFASAESSNLSYTKLQLERFHEVIDLAHSLGPRPQIIHAANSGAMLQMSDETRFDMVRPGIMLYGYAPSAELQRMINLQPVMTLKTQVVFVKKPEAGTKIGYGSTWLTPGERWIATLPIGYGDGYPRNAGNNSRVALRGRRCPVVGIVSMDQITVDAGEEAYLGDDVILFGGIGANTNPLWKMCLELNTIPYEVLCGLTARVPRIILDYT